MPGCLGAAWRRVWDRQLTNRPRPRAPCGTFQCVCRSCAIRHPAPHPGRAEVLQRLERGPGPGLCAPYHARPRAVSTARAPPPLHRACRYFRASSDVMANSLAATMLEYRDQAEAVADVRNVRRGACPCRI